MTLAPHERAARPLDQLRGAFLQRLLVQSPWLAAILMKKDRRVATVAVAHASIAFVLSAWLPVALFLLGPILLGVAHVAADVRYLLLRRKLATWWLRALFATSALFILLRVLEHARVLPDAAGYELGLATLWLGAAALVAAVENGAWSRAALALFAIAGLSLVAESHPSTARLVFLHLHNWVALMAWACLFRARLKPLLLPAGVIAVGAALLASGLFFRLALHGAGASFLGLHVLQVADWLAPGLPADLALGLTASYVFLQSIHYAIWLNLIPQEATTGQGTLTFRMSLRSLLADFGRKGLAFVVVAVLAVIVLATFDARRTRDLYVSLATFHGYLELTMLTYFWVARRMREREPVALELATSPA